MTAAIIIIGIILYYLLGKSIQNIVLVLLSGYVYWIVSPGTFIPVMITAFCMALYSLWIPRTRKLLVLCQPIGLLIAAFVICRFNDNGNILGFSVVAFSSISLLVDQYRTGTKYSFVDSLSYILFVPKIFAGPIVRADKFVCGERKKFNPNVIYRGIKYLIFAAFTKLIMADTISSCDFQCSGWEMLIQIFMFALNFFFDFWAYSLMAIGAGLIFGYELPVSFNRPYYSSSFREFWHRWNITLGTWLRDYIYIPLGGKNNKNVGWSFTILVVFLVSGLWHGSTLPFIVWGLIHGLLLIVERLVVKPEHLVGFPKIIYCIAVIIVVSFLWQLFILENINAIGQRLTCLFTLGDLRYVTVVKLIFSIFGMILLTSSWMMSAVTKQYNSRRAIVKEVTILSVMLVVLVLFNRQMSLNFFYFRF